MADKKLALACALVAPFPGSIAACLAMALASVNAFSDAAPRSALDILYASVIVLTSVISMGFLGALFIGLPVMLTIGLSAHAYFFQKNWRRWPVYMLSGAGFGAVVLVCIGIPGISLGIFRRAIDYNADVRLEMLFGVVAGGVSAFAFWFLRRPDVTPPQTQSNTAP